MISFFLIFIFSQHHWECSLRNKNKIRRWKDDEKREMRELRTQLFKLDFNSSIYTQRGILYSLMFKVDGNSGISGYGSFLWLCSHFWL